MKTLIINGGTIEDAFALSYIEQVKPDCILAADRGMEFCYRNQIKPDVILGDYDSADKTTLEAFRQQSSIEWHQYQPEKDYTDSEIAIGKAMERNSSEIHILGGTGTRLDHVLGNIQLLMQPLAKDIPCFLIDSHNRIRLLKERTILSKSQQFGKYVSLLPLTTEVTGVTLTGMKYPLEDAAFTSDNTLGVSNEIIDNEAVIDLKNGILIMIESRD